MLTVDYGNYEGIGPCIELWPSDAGSLPDGGFDVDAWEDSKVVLYPKNGIASRDWFAEAHRVMRLMARQHGGYEYLGDCFSPDPIQLPG